MILRCLYLTVFLPISAGDPEGVFTINRTETNVGQLMVASRLDREHRDNYLLTVRCVSELPQGNQRSPYDPEVSKTPQGNQRSPYDPEISKTL